MERGERRLLSLCFLCDVKYERLALRSNKQREEDKKDEKEDE